MTNVVSLRRPRLENRMAERAPELSNALTQFAANASRIAHLPVRNRHDLEQAVRVLELINRHTPKLIELVADTGKQAELMEHTLRTGQMLEALRTELDRL